MFITYQGTGEGQFEEVGLCGGVVESNLGRCATKSLGSGPGLRLDGSLAEGSDAGFALLLFLYKSYGKKDYQLITLLPNWFKQKISA